MPFDLYLVPEGGRPVLVSGRHPRATLAMAIANARESNRIDREYGFKPQRRAVVPHGGYRSRPVCYVETDGSVTEVGVSNGNSEQGAAIAWYVRLVAAMIGLTMLVFTFVLSNPAWASGCTSAWQAPSGAVAQTCRHQGWTITAHMVLDPHYVVQWSNLLSCNYEDGSGQRSDCSWNFPPGGGSQGRTYFVTGNDPHNRLTTYVWGRSHRHWVTPRQERALDVRHQSKRHWTRCYMHRGVIHCADGRTVRY